MNFDNSPRGLGDASEECFRICTFAAGTEDYPNLGCYRKNLAVAMSTAEDRVDRIGDGLVSCKIRKSHRSVIGS